MLTLEQRETRQGGLGSSDVSAVVGVNPYKTRHDVYCVKRGLVEDISANTLKTRIGHVCEGISAELYCEETGATLAPGVTMVHPEITWAIATPDRFVMNDPARLVELKWVGWRLCPAWSHEEDGVPEYVMCQANWQMFVSGRRVCDVAALLGGEDFRIYRLEYHAALVERLVDICGTFWRDNVLAGIPPTVDGTKNAREMLEALYREQKPKLLRAPSSVESWIERYAKALADEKDADRRKTEATNMICEFIGKNDADGLESVHGKFYWKRAKGNKRRTPRLIPAKGDAS